MFPRVSTALFAILAFVAISVAAQETNDDKKAIQGSWSAKKGDKSAKLTFAADKFTLEMGGKKIEGTFRLDSAKTPKQIDMTVGEASHDEAKKFAGKTSKGIYELGGDRLKWLAPEPGKEERPEAMPAEGEQTKFLFLTFDREKK